MAVEFRILGALEVAADGQLLELGAPKQKALLAALLVNANHAVTEEALIAAVWGERPPGRATANVQVYVSALRQVLEPERSARSAGSVLVTDAGGYVLRVAPEQLDASVFGAGAEAGRRALAEGRAEAAAERLVAALALWRGPAMGEFAAEPFALGEATRLEEARLAAIEDRIGADMTLGRHRDLVPELDALVREYPFAERLAGALMLALYRSGRQVDALRVYERVRRGLSEEVGIVPGPELARLHHQVLVQHPVLSWQPDVGGAAAGTRDSLLASVRRWGPSAIPEGEGNGNERSATFVGRARELTRIAERLSAAIDGGGGVVLLDGEAGIGKTRTAAEAATRAQRRDVSVLRGRCPASAWSLPYAAIGEAIDTYAASLSDASLEALGGTSAPILATIAPNLERICPADRAVVALVSAEARARLIDAAVRFVHAVAATAPVLVVVEDLHLADDGTIALIRDLVRRSTNQPLLVLGTYCSTELRLAHPLAEAITSMDQHDRLTRVQLVGLTPAEVAELLAGRGLSAALRAAVVAESAGNPLFIREVLAHLDRSEVAPAAAGSPSSLADFGIPRAVGGLVIAQVARLSADGVRLVEAASASGETFTYPVVRHAARVGHTDGLDALEELLAAKLIAPTGEVETFEFSHAVARQTIYATLSPSRQVRIHRRLAEAMGGQDTAPTPAQLADGAAQWAQSANLDGAGAGLDTVLAAADHAASVGAADREAALLRAALALSAPEDPGQVTLSKRLGLALAWSLRVDEAQPVVTETAAAIERAEGRDAAGVYLADVATALRLVGTRSQAWKLASAVLGEVPAGDAAGWTLLSLIARGGPEAEPSSDTIVGEDEQRAAGELLCGAPEPLRGWAAEVWGAFRPLYRGRGEVLRRWATDPEALLNWAGAFEPALVAWTVRAEAAEASGRLAHAALCSANVARALTALGRLDDAQDRLAAAEALRGRAGGGDRLSMVLLSARDELCMAADEGWEFQYAAASNYRDVMLDPGHRFSLAAGYAALARVGARVGDLDMAMPFLELAVGALSRVPHWRVVTPRMICDCAEALWLLDRREHLAAIEAAVREKVVALDRRAPMMDGRLALGRLCALEGDHAMAQKWFDEARRTFDEQGAAPLRAIVDYDEALMLVRRNDARTLPAAADLLARARGAFDRLHMVGWILRADAVAKQLAG